MAREIIFYKNIIENMKEGVMTLDMAGTVTMYNDAAKDILGIPVDKVLNKPFGRVFMMELEDNDEFNQVILDAIYDAAVGKTATISFQRPDNTSRVLSMSTSYLKSEEEEKKKNAGVIIVFSDITQITKSREKEEELNLKLRNAFVKAEEINKNLNAALKKVQFIRVFITMIVILGFIGGGYYVWNQDVLPQSLFSTTASSGADAASLDMIPVKIQRQRVTTSISLAGFVAPLEEINVVAPFDGKVKKKFFVYDQRVQKGDLLLTMDTSQLQVSLRGKKAAYIKSRQNHNKIKNWEKGVDMSRARRSVTKAKKNLDRSKRKLAETKVLFEKGIIAASELESAKMEYFNQQLDFTAVQEQLDGELAKGNKENVDIAEMELKNARVSVEEIEAKLGQASICSPVSGIIILPTQGSSKEEKNKLVEPGISVSQGAILLSVGNLDGLSVKAKVDEIDVGKIDFDQKVIVSGDAFSDIPLEGRVSQISSNAVGSGEETPMFDVTVGVRSLTQTQKTRIKLGMSTNIEILVYENLGAVVIPLQAVKMRGNKKWVIVKNTANASFREIEITTGMTTLSGVEVLKGLEESDQVFISNGSPGVGSSMPDQLDEK